jgi:hypothetical protein
LRAIGREGGLVIEGWRVGEALDAAAVGVDAVDVGRARTLGGEGDPVDRARPSRVVVEGAGLGEGLLGGAVGVCDVELSLRWSQVCEEDAVGSDRGESQGSKGTEGQRRDKARGHGCTKEKMFEPGRIQRGVYAFRARLSDAIRIGMLFPA